jgi:hypothetical protein
VIKYTDDVSILMTSQDDGRTVPDAIACYEKATGATLNIEKSSAPAVGTWDTACEITGLPYSEEIKILGVKIRKTETVGASKLDEIGVLGTHADPKSI